MAKKIRTPRLAWALTGSGHFFTESLADGTFAFQTLPLGTYTLDFEDPIGTGKAHAVGTLSGIAVLGDVTLDASAPVVAQSTPAPSATGV